ncbi:uncharacterized protein N7515_003720 [Penicillium bovifimosum]|uniref:CFEM domain-containing protein n=1 Tax=Penicillium bovifimosum TaxID=126998 RepID=A0A9W9H576_9EURO|nr:uncharacterized protein N7515_003720 [Penicillium bovifimosum]KAJ5138872.1 hypothetical protein N7515_003720 [Penicillium bovifimosum]
MRVFKIAALVGAVCATTVIAAGPAEMAAVLPQCAMKCMMTSVSESSCAPTDQACMCKDAHYTAVLEKCVMLTCNIHESLTTKNVTSTACGAPIRNRTKLVSYSGVIGGVLALIAFILRMIARLNVFGGVFGMDDWTMLLTMILLIPLSALSVVLADTGLGRDMWTIPFENITHVLYIYFWDELLYLSILPMTKISICCFYLRIFPDKKFRLATYITIGLNVGYLIAFVLISVFQCKPLPGAWHRWDNPEAYKCNAINAQGWAAAVINMVLDITVMVLPLRQLYHLNLSVKRKSYVMCMFGLGIFVTLVSILRLNSLIHFASTTNLTWDYVSIGYWSTIECDVGVICACLPAIRSLLRRVAPGLFGDTQHTKSGYGVNSHSRGNSRMGIGNSQSKNDFYPLDDVEHSDEARLHHPHPV